MPGFEALYKQTVTLFQRVTVIENSGDSHAGKTVTTHWVPILLENVHLIVDRAIIVATYGEQATDNARLHVRYNRSGTDAIVAGRVYYTPKDFARLGDSSGAISFKFGELFDFFIEGDYTDLGVVNDDSYKNGFYNYMNRTFDNVFVITNVSKYNLIPHFEITAK